MTGAAAPDDADDLPRPRSLTRRRLLGSGGVGMAAWGLAACGTGSPEPARPPSTPPACVLTPEGTEGPYYLDLDLMRTDLTEDRAGMPLRLSVTLQDARSCAVIPDAAVDVWHADPDGVYSGTSADGTEGETFLRGVQVTDAAGLVEFDTLYPGWYPGRTNHIHVKVHLGGTTVHTGQLYFPEQVNGAVAEVEAYGRHGRRDTSNDSDMYFPDTGAGSTLAVTGSPDAGYAAAITLGVRTA